MLLRRSDLLLRMVGSKRWASTGVLLYDKKTKVPSFGGSLWAVTPFKLKVSPLLPHDYPNLDEAFLKVYGNRESLRDATEFSHKMDGRKLKFYAAAKNKVPKEETRDVRAEIQVPVVHNLHLDVSGEGCIDVSDFVETEYCHLKTDDGDVNVSRIKTNTMTIQSTGKGHINCSGAIQGNVKITSTGSGNVVCDKRLSGQSMDITTEKGDIRVGACYSETSKFVTSFGSLNLRNIHNESYVAVYEQGDVKMQGVDGSTNIFVKRGDIECHISNIRHESRIHAEEGDIVVKLSDTSPLKISVNAVEIIPDIKFSVHGELSKKSDGCYNYYATIQPDKFSPTLEIIAENGRVILESQDWAASLGLKIPINNITHLG